MTATREDLSARLASIASRHLGGPVAIDNLQPLSGGASADTWQFEASCGGKYHSMILRLAAPGGDQDPIRVDRATEARLQQLAAGAGVPVAPVVFVLEEDDGPMLQHGLKELHNSIKSFESTLLIRLRNAKKACVCLSSFFLYKLKRFMLIFLPSFPFFNHHYSFLKLLFIIP